MRISLHILIIIILISISCSTSLAQDRFKKKKYIFELDITKSMCGYGGAPAIFEQVINQLCAAIENINDANSEIVISTFQDKIVNTWSVKDASSDSKKVLIKNLKDIKCENLAITSTNTYVAWADAKRNLDASKINIVFILTDGQHNSSTNSKTEMLNMISNWDNNTEEAYAILVQLTSSAIDNDVRQRVESTNNVQIIQGIEFFVLQIKEPKQIVNTEETMEFEIDLTKDNWKKAYDNVDLTFNFDNQYFELSKYSCKISDLPIKIQLKPKVSIDQIKQELQKTSFSNLEIIINDNYPQIKLIDNKVSIQINNKKEKILKLWVVN